MGFNLKVVLRRASVESVYTAGDPSVYTNVNVADRGEYAIRHAESIVLGSNARVYRHNIVRCYEGFYR